MNLHLHHAHAWDVTPAQAAGIQARLAAQVRVEPLAHLPATIAGVDVSVREGAGGSVAQAAVVLLSFPALEGIERAVWRGPVAWPYVPGLLSFREVPALLHALEKLNSLPDLIMADAQGIAHPRRLGLASHLGVLLDLPVIGVAKSRLIGAFVEPADVVGAQTPLLADGEQVGAVLRTRAGVRPLCVSVGHRVTLPEAIDLVLRCCTRYRMPEPTRLAHLLSRADVA